MLLPLLLLPLFITLISAKVFRALLLLLLLLELLVELLGAKAPASAKVANVLLLLDPPPLPESPPLTARSVAAGELPKELITTASVVDIWLLLSMATAATGLIEPLVTPCNNTIFFKGSSSCC